MHATKQPTADEVYELLEKDFDAMIGKIIKVSKLQFGSFEELKADCGLYFIKAFNKYNPEKRTD